MQRFLSLLLVVGLFGLSSASSDVLAADLTPEKITELERIVSPHIVGETLFIDGRIGSHIYDFLAYETVALKTVKFVELNSLGGDVDWGLQIADKLKTMKIDTRLKGDKYCASACTYLYAAGVHRIAAKGTWFGVHGARLGAGYTTTFAGLCFVDIESGESQFFPNKKGCGEFLKHWYDLSFEATNKSFAFMESNGVLAKLRETYYAMPDDPAWADDLNVLRKPDWFLKSEEAVQYGLVTDLQ